MDKRVLYSQNFLKDKALVSRLIEQSSITKDDIVYEVGAGAGIITEQLVTRAGKVIAFEIDGDLFKKLSNKFASRENY